MVGDAGRGGEAADGARAVGLLLDQTTQHAGFGVEGGEAGVGGAALGLEGGGVGVEPDAEGLGGIEAGAGGVGVARRGGAGGLGALTGGGVVRRLSSVVGALGGCEVAGQEVAARGGAVALALGALACGGRAGLVGLRGADAGAGGVEGLPRGVAGRLGALEGVGGLGGVGGGVGTLALDAVGGTGDGGAAARGLVVLGAHAGGVGAGAGEALVGEAVLGVEVADAAEVGVEGLPGVEAGGFGARAREGEGGGLGVERGRARVGAREVGVEAAQAGRGGVALVDEARVLGVGEEVVEAREAGAEVAVAPGAVGLSAQRRNAGGEFAVEVADAGEVVARRVEARDRLLAAQLVARHARRLLEEPPPVLVGLREQILHHRQFDDRVRARAEAGVEEQVLHVAEPTFDAVEQVFRLARPVQPSPDGHLGVGRRQHAARVLDRQPHVGEAEGLARFRAVEEHARHRVRAQHAGALLADDPPHRVDDVALARAVGPDDARHARREGERRLVGEALEAVEVEAAEEHAAGPEGRPRRSGGARGGTRAGKVRRRARVPGRRARFAAGRWLRI